MSTSKVPSAMEWRQPSRLHTIPSGDICMPACKSLFEYSSSVHSEDSDLMDFDTLVLKAFAHLVHAPIPPRLPLLSFRPTKFHCHRHSQVVQAILMLEIWQLTMMIVHVTVTMSRMMVEVLLYITLLGTRQEAVDSY